MHSVVELRVVGLGIVLYSPFAVAHIRDGEDYLRTRFWDPADVAAHVVDCRISAMGTGTPGDYKLKLFDGPYPREGVRNAAVAIRLGIEIRDRTLCVRDLYDLIEWAPVCPPDQTVSLQDGFYRITVFTSPPPSGILGDNQEISVHLEPTDHRPELKWSGVPDISRPNDR